MLPPILLLNLILPPFSFNLILIMALPPPPTPQEWQIDYSLRAYFWLVAVAWSMVLRWILELSLGSVGKTVVID